MRNLRSEVMGVLSFQDHYRDGFFMLVVKRDQKACLTTQGSAGGGARL